MSKWYVAYVGVRQEFRASADLNAKGIEAYVPRERHSRTHARIVDTVDRVIFPRYLFFKLDEGQSFYTVRKTEGVESIIGATTRRFTVKLRGLFILNASSTGVSSI